MTDLRPLTIADVGLFTGVPQHENFSRIKDLLPTRAMAPSSKPSAWPRGDAITLPATYYLRRRIAVDRAVPGGHRHRMNVVLGVLAAVVVWGRFGPYAF